MFLAFSFSIYVFYVGQCDLWVLVGLAKLHCGAAGATPPSVMVLFEHGVLMEHGIYLNTVSEAHDKRSLLSLGRGDGFKESKNIF